MSETIIVKFNIGGQRFDVSESFLSLHPNTMLAKSASEEWQKDPEKVIFMDRDGAMFAQVLNYLRDGRVDLPCTINKSAFLYELVYYGVEKVDEDAVEDANNTRKLGANFLLLDEARAIHQGVHLIIDTLMRNDIDRMNGLFYVNVDVDKHRHFHKYLEGNQSKANEKNVRDAINEYLHKVGLDYNGLQVVNYKSKTVRIRIL